jgi:hypothetical protein
LQAKGTEDDVKALALMLLLLLENVDPEVGTSEKPRSVASQYFDDHIF